MMTSRINAGGYCAVWFVGFSLRRRGGFGLVRLMRVLVVLAVVGSVLAPSSDVGSDAVAAQTVGGMCDAEGVEQFSDVGADDYGAAHILCNAGLGVVGGSVRWWVRSGRGVDSWADGFVFWCVLWRDVLGRECPEEGASPFVDVAGSVHEVNIGCLFGLEITKGTTAVTYGPGEKLKASQISRFLLRVYEGTGGRCDVLGDEFGSGVVVFVGVGGDSF